MGFSKDFVMKGAQVIKKSAEKSVVFKELVLD